MQASFRYGEEQEQAALEDIQRRASLQWEEYRAALLAHPEAVELPLTQLRDKRVRVAMLEGCAVGFSAVLPRGDGGSELDGLFVEPNVWGKGIGRALVEDAAALARLQGSRSLEVIGNPRAKGFYEKCGFVEFGVAETQFGPGILMRLLIPG